MPIEIKELHIRIKVNETSPTDECQTDARSADDKLIQACVERVMEIIDQKKER